MLSDAVQAIRLGQKGMAREILASILRKNPQDEQAYIWSAAVAETPEGAIALLEKLIELNPQNALAWKTLAAHRLAQQPTPTKLPLGESTPPSNNAATVPAVAAIKRESCLVCGREREEEDSHSVCASCGCPLSLGHLATAQAKGTVNERSVETAVSEMIHRGDSSGQVMLGVAIGLMSMYRSGDALQYLKRAADLAYGGAQVREACAEVAARKLVLIVDDSATVRRLVSTALERNGLRVSSAVNGRQGFEKFQKETPDFVLTDITMPEMDGYEFCKAVRRHPSGKGLPVVMLSGNDGLFDKVRGKVAGATDHLNKPFHNDVLTAAVNKHLRKGDNGKGFRIFDLG
ncbi:MAG: response regulator [Acidobacteria bacterium]|nr:response regulator [Acidobacteriota bacterium]